MTDLPKTAQRSEGLRKMVIPRSVDGKPLEKTIEVAPDRPNPRAGRYELETTSEPPPIPNGWYAISRSENLLPGDIRPETAVARELVVYRDTSGTAHVANAHCPHLGAHLGGGLIVEDTIKCPYHGWRFGPDGTCVEIPYSEARIPSKACLVKYPVCEQDGFVFFWYHAGAKAPNYQLPRVEEMNEEMNSEGWSKPYPWNFELVAALQEMAENNVDYAHLRYVHQRPYVPNDTSKFTTDGPFSTVVELLPDGQEFDRMTWGPGIAILRIPGLMTIFTTTTPIDRRHCNLQWNFLFHGEAEKMAADLIEGVTGEFGLMADVPIWRDKVFMEQPVLVKADGNIAEFRRWYAQFYET